MLCGTEILHPILLAAILAGTVLAAQAAVPEDLPDAEKSIANTVDPWGLPFSDQLTRFRGRFEEAPAANFCVGVTHDLVKTWSNKYWFRGDSFTANRTGRIDRAETIWAAAGTTAAFQIAILPRTGALSATYHLEVEVQSHGAYQPLPAPAMQPLVLTRAPARHPEATVELFREVFVKTVEPAYPRYNVERWPDPLVPESSVTLEEGLELGVFWIDVHPPAGMLRGTILCQVKVTDGSQQCKINVPIRVVGGLELAPNDYPFIGWFRPSWGGGELSYEQYRDMCGMVLAHHMYPMDALRHYWDADDPSKFDQLHQYLAERGMKLFDIGWQGDEEMPALYDHVKEQGWLDQAVIYSNADEPDDETFANSNIPFCQMIHEKYPGLRVYLASEWHENMAQGCDIWMTDVSSHRYDPQQHKHIKQPALWHYYCHLPVRWQMRDPLVMAPNMQIDNPALEHRLALIMSYHYGAKGVFTWTGFSAGGLKDDFWQTLQLPDQPSGFPYAGIHNGNNFRVYPPRTEGGPVLPSLRLKVTRAALEDIALLRAAQQMIDEGRIDGDAAQQLEEFINPVPELFRDFHYWDRTPQALLAWHEQILRTVADALE